MAGGGYERIFYPRLELAAEGKHFDLPSFPARHASANHLLMWFALAYASGLERSAHRRTVLNLAHSQTEPGAGGPRAGLGVVDGRVEQFTPDPHAGFHLLPTLVILDRARQEGDVEVAEAWARVLGGWLGLWSLGASEDGQVVLPGTRFWPVKGPPPLGPDGWCHLAPGSTLSQCVDGCYRLLAGLPQRDNKGGVRGDEWIAGRQAPGWAAVRLLQRMLAGGLVVERREPKLAFPVARLEEGGVVRLWFTRSAADVGGVLHSLAPVVEAQWVVPGQHAVSWAASVEAPGMVRAVPQPEPPAARLEGVWLPQEDVERLVGVLDILERLRMVQ